MKTILLFYCSLSAFLTAHAQQAIQISGNMKMHPGAQMNILGNFINNGNFEDYGASITFGANSVISGDSQTPFKILRIENNASVTLQQNCQVTDTLYLVSGYIDLNSKTLSILNSSPNAIVRTAGYIISEDADNSSRVSWLVTGTGGNFTIPFGTSGGIYIPMTLGFDPGEILLIGAATYPTSDANLPLPVSPIPVTNMNDSVAIENSLNTVNRFWFLESESINALIDLTLTAAPSEVGTIELLQVTHWDTVNQIWEESLPGQISSATSAMVTGVPSDGEFTVHGTQSTLLVNNLLFDAWPSGDQVEIKWETAFEINNDYFTVEKSKDLLNYDQLITVEGHGTTPYRSFYSTVDENPLDGISFYRVKVTALDGAEVFSEPVQVEFFKKPVINVFPNPVTEAEFSVSLNHLKDNSVQLRILDMNGMVIKTIPDLAPDSEQFLLRVDGLEDLSQGLYLVEVSGKFGQLIQKIIVN